MRLWPAVDITSLDADSDFILAAVDEFGPAAAEQLGDTFRIFFATPDDRDAALTALRATGHSAAGIDVDDEDWARRSQDGLGPITVGRITVFPQPLALSPVPVPVTGGGIAIVILPSMGFGTGHHATTRLCLAALQELDVTGRRVLDVGTGSGILAIAASLLGAAQVVGIDTDADAIQAATDNILLNPGARVALRVGDLNASKLDAADIVTANLTGALLQRSAAVLTAFVKPGGTLIISGFLEEELDDVRKAFSTLTITWEQEEQHWMSLAMKKA